MKSHVPKVQGQLDILRCIYLDACAECSVNPSQEDIDYIQVRVEDEGLSFLTITLPSFARDFERSLADGRIRSSSFRSFRKYRNKTCDGSIPSFLRGMISIIFDRTTGVLYENPLAEKASSVTVACVVRSVRQICRTFNKLQAECSLEREEASLQGFAHIEQTLATFKIHADDKAAFDAVSRLLWDPLFQHFDVGASVPRHGPGSCAEELLGNQKFRWRTWHERLEDYFPFLGFCLPLGASLEKEFLDVRFLSTEQELPSRVIPVPKTMQGPRIIAAEPLAAQYAQQALRSYLYRTIEKSGLLGSRINFRDQTINQRLALMSSTDGTMATLDLSDASDRVIHDIAMSMFHGSPVLAGAVQACRTSYAKLPNGALVGPLRKFASMGSALCFPVESMYFYTICVVTLIRKRKLLFDVRSVHKVGKDIFVYGDDLVVPSDEADAITAGLEKYYSKVNVHKSFSTGKFRESCGLDAYDGEVVTPTYVRQCVPSDRRQHSEIISIAAAANSFYMKGYWQTAGFLFERIERLLGTLPVISADSPAVGRISFLCERTFHRWNNSLQRHEIRAFCPETVYRTDRLEGYAALGKSLSALNVQAELDGQRDPLHLERSARHGVAALKRRWVPV